MKNKHKALIGLGIVTAVAVGYYFYSKKSEVKKAEPETKKPEEKAADTSVSASQPKKELTREEADKIAKEIYSIEKREESMKVGKGYISPATALRKQLIDGGYSYKKVQRQAGKFTGVAIKLNANELVAELGLNLDIKKIKLQQNK
jgi:hypothetical protein